MAWAADVRLDGELISPAGAGCAVKVVKASKSQYVRGLLAVLPSRGCKLQRLAWAEAGGGGERRLAVHLSRG